MAHLWVRDGSEGWLPVALDGAPCAVRESSGGATVRPAAEAPAAAPLLLRARGADEWLLLCGPGAAVAVNGTPLRGLGARALRDRDEIRLPGGTRVYLATVTPARVEAYPGGRDTAECPRCTGPLAPGEPAVRCPACGIWHHQEESRPCWTYAAACASCGGETALDGRFAWAPEEE